MPGLAAALIWKLKVSMVGCIFLFLFQVYFREKHESHDNVGLIDLMLCFDKINEQDQR
jgi:hypothetical protein